MKETLKQRILNNCKEIDGKQKLCCSDAFKIATDLDINTKEVGDACNELEVKIYGCQLGCF